MVWRVCLQCKAVTVDYGQNTDYFSDAMALLCFSVCSFFVQCLYTGGAAIAAPLPVLLILSLPMAGQREELYSLKTATVPYCYAHPEMIVVDQQLLHRNF